MKTFPYSNAILFFQIQYHFRLSLLTIQLQGISIIDQIIKNYNV